MDARGVIAPEKMVREAGSGVSSSSSTTIDLCYIIFGRLHKKISEFPFNSKI